MFAGISIAGLASGLMKAVLDPRVICAAIAALALWGAWSGGERMGETSVRAEWSEAKLDASEKARAAEKTMLRKLAVAQRDLEQERATHAKREADLRRDIELGDRRLLILARLPGGAPADPAGAGGGDAEPVELSPAARQAYHDLRAGIARDTDTLKACQAYVTAIGGWPPPE
ncbi:MAG: lysis system i-spanin subunit Rz [Parvibaculum sp.]|uniref:lysis system i-spanin subunit Rz n=1 Tax=Parvibaculum sp. TaxID=2024848 RepID=UPI002AB9033E|nr:lysis system i-spanin subunit Rz [Parvibaculum sp.]MDZ4382790.1 lysis system i-spanin subunit Rz [Parvibaculum sp.]